ncbi:hypothetical protein GCM10017044_03310 [Kordiimonas sediminis]|uniref:Methylated-DNA-[protein]-cysteine S-methyltransferase DNA binding domain-containing protein n=1 Tax=Kordiimonas sediminis TaxID=1735581 RepID=A0A919E4Z0_9PROT|nr:MGMT family protein [Kordiimonas sediminis]GHF12683.1 hypothetical protein GCM10017044_03310 [Kordiimonas sediminis]
MRVRPDVADRIYALVRHVQFGEVASYGMIASLLPGVTARMVGTAMSGAPQDVPWQRIINSGGKISDRDGADRQRLRLEEEGVSFSPSGRISWKQHGWAGPSDDWLASVGLEIPEYLAITQAWPGRR